SDGCCFGGGSDQSVDIDNEGFAIANTGFNFAVGNASDNEASNDQDADADSDGGDAIAVNHGGASNHSDGTATIETGDATATGVDAETSVNQEADSDGCCFGGGSDQSVEVHNEGFAIANTGFNFAVGNASHNEASNDQDADADSDGGRCCGGDAVASNFGGASNHSDGTAHIETGDATATGVDADIFVNQISTGGCCFGGGSDQSVDVDNEGFAIANTGFNFAVGNVSDNEADNDQDADADGDGGRCCGSDAVAINVGGASNHSDGSAHIDTGDATAVGVSSATFISQAAESRCDDCDRDHNKGCDDCDRDHNKGCDDRNRDHKQRCNDRDRDHNKGCDDRNRDHNKSFDRCDSRKRVCR
ncbi:MAG TPA: hypothetical protein VGR26_07580, partial [Acidimicrobiales bacterium]|nr:hypothetical protein [Acidimicrobiales bacterium]